ncbi:MAG TPA: hypothetical protein PKD12_09165 [Nitrospira sp.]|nr:hypothetical protein [Nitrospira sp.]
MSKKPKPAEYKFKIDAFSPQTIPMVRLGEYLSSLAKFLGETGMVHFVDMRQGSTVLLHKIQTEAVPKVQARIERVRKGIASMEEMRPYETLNEMLREDNGIGFLHAGRGKILKFPGRESEDKLDYGEFYQEGSIDGIPIWVGGTQEVINITVQEGKRTFRCTASKDIGRKIADHLWSTPLRFSGRGRWKRSHHGDWELMVLKVNSFTPLKTTSLQEVVGELRSIQGSEWATINDPWVELRKLRQGNGGTT